MKEATNCNACAAVFGDASEHSLVDVTIPMEETDAVVFDIRDYAAMSHTSVCSEAVADSCHRVSVYYDCQQLIPPNTALEATPHSHCDFASEFSGCLARWVRGASAFVR
jgi:hypothetical protein